MSDYDEILNSLPIDKIAAQLGEDPAAVQQAAQTALPALLGGLQANAQDPAGAASLLGALDQHTGEVDVDAIDVADGEKAAAHIFGANQDQVINQLGATGVSSGLVKKLMPILIPIVLAFISKKLTGGTGAAPSQSADSGILGQILSQVLGGAQNAPAGGTTTQAGATAPSAGSIITDILGGLLGGGRR